MTVKEEVKVKGEQDGLLTVVKIFLLLIFVFGGGIVAIGVLAHWFIPK